MKKFISKIKKSCHNFVTGKSGFSLVELIVVIAIMAVMAAVLAPALLGYVERSRAQKDTSAMGEVTNAIQLSLADQNVYDELLPYAVKGNFSCYADGDTSTNTDANKTITKAPDYWFFTDEARKLDETAYFPAGSMRGATVTFKPNGEAEYILKDGIVNKIGDESTKKGTNGGAVLENCPELYNRLRSTVGDTIKVSSQTYRNSTYTIFISMGTTGGNQADKQDAIQVYGQYNGTNLPEVITATGSASQDKGNAGAGGSEQPGAGTPTEPETVAGSATFGCHVDAGGYIELSTPITLTWDKLKLAENGNEYSYDVSKINDTGTLGLAFQSCLPLEGIVIPHGITKIPTGAFGASGLNNITIPQSVTEIGSVIFELCGAGNDMTITYLGTKEQWQEISKPDDWNVIYEVEGIPYYAATRIICTDGILEL